MKTKRKVSFNMVWMEYEDGSSALFPDRCICGSDDYYIQEGTIKCNDCHIMRPFSSWSAPPEVQPQYTGDNDFKQSGR